MKTFTIRISGILFMSSSSQFVGCLYASQFVQLPAQNGDQDIYWNTYKYVYKWTFEKMRCARMSWAEELLTLWRNGNLDKLSTCKESQRRQWEEKLLGSESLKKWSHIYSNKTSVIEIID